MAFADGGGVRKGLSDGTFSGGGLFGGVIGKRLADSEGEIGGEHLVLQAGQFLFDDSHWKSGERRNVRREPDGEANVRPSNGQSRNTAHSTVLFSDFSQVQNYIGVSDGALNKQHARVTLTRCRNLYPVSPSET